MSTLSEIINSLYFTFTSMNRVLKLVFKEYELEGTLKIKEYFPITTKCYFVQSTKINIATPKLYDNYLEKLKFYFNYLGKPIFY